MLKQFKILKIKLQLKIRKFKNQKIANFMIPIKITKLKKLMMIKRII